MNKAVAVVFGLARHAGPRLGFSLGRCVAFAALAALAAAALLPGAALGQFIAPLDNPRRTVVVRVFEAASPAVVNISTTTVRSVSAWGGGIFDEIFPMAPGPRRNVNVTSLGSGFVIHPDGYIVTNEHVVQRATQITVTLADGAEFPAEVVSTDNAHDLAILKIDPGDDRRLQALTLGRSDELMVGENVIAIGNPKGYKNSVTSGLVSALGRELEFGGQASYAGLIQTDAAINPGNSGGPLLNVNAEVIGLNTAIRADAQNIGFAIAIDDVVRDLPRLLDLRGINRLDLGFEPSVGDNGNGPLELRVKNVRPDGPATAAGLVEGAVIRGLDGQALHSPADFFIAMLALEPGQRVRLDTDAGACTLTAAQLPEPDGAELARRRLGVSLRAVTAESARTHRLGVSQGLLVTGVFDGGPAAKLGVRPGDVIFQLGQGYVTSLEQVGRLLERVQTGQPIRIGLARGNTIYHTTLAAGDLP